MTRRQFLQSTTMAALGGALGVAYTFDGGEVAGREPGDA